MTAGGEADSLHRANAPMSVRQLHGPHCGTGKIIIGGKAVLPCERHLLPTVRQAPSRPGLAQYQNDDDDEENEAQAAADVNGTGKNGGE